MRLRFLSTPSARRATDGMTARLYVFSISIHALREEGDHPSAPGSCKLILFLSTPSARRATSVTAAGSVTSVNFYPRPPRGGRRRLLGQRHWRKLFLSTPSARRATRFKGAATDGGKISIHALREEGDIRGRKNTCSGWNFYPRPPRGGRHTQSTSYSWQPNFYPRPPRGGRPR